MDVNGEDQLVITYYLPEGKGHKDDAQGKFKRKEDIMECCENALILKTYYGIRKQIIEVLGSEQDFLAKLQEMKNNYEARQAKKPNLKNTIGKLF